MNKMIAMIPLRLGSKRVPKKNLRILKGKPLCSYIIESVIESGFFNKEDIYINSEAEEFKPLADYYEISFYKRPELLASDNATNDDFVLDFLESHNCKQIFQFLATSPLLLPSTIKDFCDKAVDYKVFVSIVTHQIECLYNNEAINFDFTKQTPPSQLLSPVSSYACGMMAWDVVDYIDNYKKFKASYHGGDSLKGYYSISGLEAIDVDRENDFILAELAMEARSKSKYIKPIEPTYWDGLFTNDEIHVPNILEKDGINESFFESENKLVTNVFKVLSSHSTKDSWIHRVVNTNSNSACLITQQPGEGNRLHSHPDWDEFWYIVRGQWDFTVSDHIYKVKEGDIVLIPRNTFHQITATGNSPATRLAVSRQDVVHSYPLTNVKI